jgi:multiple sugar transport system permease protein
VKGKRLARRLLFHVAILVGAMVFMVPFLWTVATSLKTDQQVQDISSFIRIMIPWPLAWGNYVKTLVYIDFVRYFLNTVYVTLMSIIGTVVSCSLVAFAFARLRWPGRDALFLLVLSTMMLPAQVTMIPVFLIFTKLGMVDTLKPLWLPTFFGTAFFIFLLRQFFLTIPHDLEDAAKIDGCGYFRIFYRIMLPLIKPAVTAVVIFQFMWTWNDFLNPLIYITTRKDLMTLTIALQSFNHLHGVEWSLLMAASVMMTIPVILIFFFAQKYFIQGITLTGLKG